MAGLIDLHGNSLGSQDIVDDHRSSRHRDEVEDLYQDTMGFINTRGMYPTKIIFFVTGCYQDMVRRSFEANVSNDDIRRLGSYLDDTMRNNTDLIGLSGIANNIIKPSVEIDSEISIRNGWAEPRCRFFMEFRKPNVIGDWEDGSDANSYTTYVYTGFTDYAGVTENGLVDESMPMHVTAMSVISHTNNGYGRLRSRVMSDKNIIVNNHYYGDDRSIDRKNEWIMDPGNVVMMKHSNDSFMDTSINGGRLQPSTARASRTIKGVNRSYNIPSHYLSKIINVMGSVQDSSDIYNDDDYNMEGVANAYTRMHSLLRMGDMDSDPLTAIYRDDGFMSSATLTFGQLQEYFPNCTHHSVLKLIFPAELRGGHKFSLESRLRDAGQSSYDSESWRGSDSCTIAANMLVQQLPNLMVSEFIQSMRFSIHSSDNAALGESYYWIIGDENRRSRDNRSSVMFLTDFPHREQMNRIEALKLKIEEVLLDVITVNGMIPINLMVDCDLLSDITIYISLDGGPEYKFVMPTFADSMTTSLITTDTDHYMEFSTDLVGLVEQVV